MASRVIHGHRVHQFRSEFKLIEIWYDRRQRETFRKEMSWTFARVVYKERELLLSPN